MTNTTRRIVCEVCGLGYPAVRWRENMGYCPNCDQPYGPNARKLLDLPRADLDVDMEMPPDLLRHQDETENWRF
jgi:hypothetical protein